LYAGGLSSLAFVITLVSLIPADLASGGTGIFYVDQAEMRCVRRDRQRPGFARRPHGPMPQV